LGGCVAIDVQSPRLYVYPSVTLAQQIEQAAEEQDLSVSQWMQEAARQKLQLENTDDE